MNNSHLQIFIKEIKQFEGYKQTVYLDSLGNPTCGWGHHLAEGSSITNEIAKEFLAIDVAEAISQFYRLKRLYNLRLDVVRCRVLCHMIFNLGLTALVGFRKMLNALKQCDYDTAADEMLNSKWHQQVGKRAEYLAELMRNGDKAEKKTEGDT